MSKYQSEAERTVKMKRMVCGPNLLLMFLLAVLLLQPTSVGALNSETFTGTGSASDLNFKVDVPGHTVKLSWDVHDSDYEIDSMNVFPEDSDNAIEYWYNMGNKGTTYLYGYDYPGFNFSFYIFDCFLSCPDWTLVVEELLEPETAISWSGIGDPPGYPLMAFVATGRVNITWSVVPATSNPTAALSIYNAETQEVWYDNPYIGGSSRQENLEGSYIMGESPAYGPMVGTFYIEWYTLCSEIASWSISVENLPNTTTTDTTTETAASSATGTSTAANPGFVVFIVMGAALWLVMRRVRIRREHSTSN